MIFGPVVDTDATDDVNFAAIEGNNIRKQNDVVTLDYSEVEYILKHLLLELKVLLHF